MKAGIRICSIPSIGCRHSNRPCIRPSRRRRLRRRSEPRRRRTSMYQQHFGLTELPFGITPDTSFAFACTSHQGALNTLLVAVKNGEGFIKITGEVGTGKTLLCRRFLATLDQDFVSAYIPNPYLEPRALLLALADELRVVIPQDTDQHQLM